jgi:hypothetical protein
VTGDGDGFDHRHTQLRRQLGRVDGEPAIRRFVQHVEYEHERQTGLGQLQRHDQRARQVLGIGDLHDAIDTREQDVARHALVFRIGR